MSKTFQEILSELKKPFPPDAHKERDLPGGGRWFFIPWQTIRDRLDEVCPEWQCTYSTPLYVDRYCYISCTIIICGVSREAPGNAQIELLSSKGKDMSRGTPIERATADAFKNAAEAFGIARYLDDQNFVVQYMKTKGDMRGYKFARENEEIAVGARGERPRKTDEPSQLVKRITEAQAKRLWAIARNELKLSDSDVASVLAGFGIEKTMEIGAKQYESVIQSLKDYASFEPAQSS